VLIVLAGQAAAEQTILADVYRDKLEGMWLGELMGNYAGRPQEGHMQRGGLTYTVDWLAATGGTLWDGDDDTCFELLYADVLGGNSDPNSAQIGQAWVDHIVENSFYVANRQARWLMTQGVVPPETSSQRRNMHWYSIDSQITTESLGAMSVGRRQRAVDLAGRFGGVTNSGFPLHAAEFYAAMYAAAPFETNVEQLVAKGLEIVPTTSRTHQVIQDVITWYQQDAEDEVLDWRATQTKIYDKYYGANSLGRAYYWIESTVNTGMTTLALLYGQGDYKSTVEIAVNAGFDADCNPATAGGLLGMMLGASGLPADLIDNCAGTYQASAWFQNMTRTRTISQIVDGLQTAGEGQLLLAGGSISGSGETRTYHIGDDAVTAPPEKPDPTGPKGLVGTIQAMGGTVTVSAAVEVHDPTSDKRNLEGIIDGITDVSYNGHRAYSSYDDANAQPAGGDYYQLNFDRKVRLRKVIFYEGDFAWGTSFLGIGDPRGGFFTDLTVEVGTGGTFAPASNLQFSEPLDPCAFYQVIEMTFDAADGDAVRIRGTAGGSQEFTTILELEAYGAVFQPGDANLDGQVDGGDLALMGGCWTQPSGAVWEQADFDGDGDVDGGDLSLMGGTWMWSAPAGPAPPVDQQAEVPEPLGLTLTGLTLPILMRRRRTGARGRTQREPRPPADG
jgi:hypothetical protein